eukprot:g1543.t1
MLRAIARAKLLTRAELYRLDLTLAAETAEDAKKAIAAEQKKTLEHLYALQRRMVEIRTEAKQEDTEEHNEWKEALAQARAEEEAEGSAPEGGDVIERVGKAIGEDLALKRQNLPAPLQGPTDLWTSRTPSPERQKRRQVEIDGGGTELFKDGGGDERVEEEEQPAAAGKSGSGSNNQGAKTSAASDLPFAQIDEAMRKQAGAAVAEAEQVADPCNQSRAQEVLGECCVLGPLWPLPEEGELQPPLGAKVGDTIFSVGYITEQGEKPDDPDHINQDSFVVVPFGGGSFDGTAVVSKSGAASSDGLSEYAGQSKECVCDQLMLLVCDGHGPGGTGCAQMARNLVPYHFSAAMRALGDSTSDAAYHAALASAFNHTNNCMQKWDNKEVETKVSGTTATCAVIAKTAEGKLRVHIANTGDSRAVLVSEDPANPGKLVAEALSFDHTPYRRDERDRVRAAGAKVLSRKQLKGEVEVHDNWECALGEVLDDTGDPPRLWEGDNEYPGCAFTRSLGDEVAESIGCISEPEVISVDLDPATARFVMLASDGVFEFLTNAQVCDIIQPHYPGDSAKACDAVIEKSWDLWMEEDERSDDITL